MTDTEWVDEPAAPQSGARPSPDLVAFADELRGRPGEWAKWPRATSKPSVTAAQIKAEKTYQMFAPGAFDAKVRDGEVLVRFVDNATRAAEISAKYDFSMQEVVDLVTAQGVNAYVEMTGGGVATIYAGEPYKDYQDEWRYPAVAGPGTFDETKSASFFEFWVGPDDEGDTPATTAAEAGALTVADLAKLIVAQASSPRTPLDAERVEALGLDSTLRSTPRDMAWVNARQRVWIDAANESNRAQHAAGNQPSARRDSDWVQANEAAGQAAVDAWDADPANRFA